MKKILISVFITSLLTFSACNSEPASALKNSLNKTPVTGLIGTWNYEGSDENEMVFMKASALDNDKWGFIFRDKGELVERKNNSWCGTPPVVYENYSGTWNSTPDSVLNIEVGYWGGIMNARYKIISLSGMELKIKYIN